MISALEKIEDIDETSLIALDELENRVYNNIGGICENIQLYIIIISFNVKAVLALINIKIGQKNI